MTKLINRQPDRIQRVILGALPFLLLIALYLWGSEQRLQANPNDKLLPPPGKIVSAMERLAFEPSKRSGDYLLWADTAASLQRLVVGVAVGALIGLLFGVINGALPLVHANFSPVVTAVSLIPPMAILPVLFIIFGLGELSKVVLIVIGITPVLIRDLQQRVLEIPREQLIKAQTLGANSWQIIVRVILPQIMPRLLDSVRLALGPAWLFLIAAEAIAATEGLGYRIFLVRRYLAMDTILPYVVWITLLAFALDWLLRRVSRHLWPWYHNRTGQQGVAA